jgi:hypothetical protein
MLLHTRHLPTRLLLFVAATVLLLTAPTEASLVHAEGNSQSATGAANPVTINFDSLQTNAVLPANYYQIASFSSYSGATVSTAYDCYYGWGGSCPNGIIATSGSGYYYWPTADLYVNFAMPVNGLMFKVIGSQAGGASGQIDVYVHNSYYTTTSFHSGYGYAGQTLPALVVNLSGISHITGLTIRNVHNYDYWFYTGANYLLYYDDFSFTPELFANIINPRVNGGLDQTTQNALLGGDVVLQASTSHPGGTYAWTFTPANLVSIAGSPTSSSVTIRTNDTGTINAKLTYTLNGVYVSPSFTLNSILPTVTSFSGQQIADTVTSLEICGGHGWVWYRLACTPGTSPTLLQIEGIEFNARIHSPSFISDPSQSGVKYVQAVSAFRKYQNMGTRCATKRSAETNVASGWQLDNQDPYQNSTHYFSEGNDLSLFAVDSPGQALTGDYDYLFADSAYVDDRFEMYLVYFTTNPIPNPQRPMAKVPWNWGGLVVFDSEGHHIRYSNSTPGTRPSQNTTFMVPMDGIRRSSDPEVVCPGYGPLSTNHIDATRVQVRYFYSEILRRPADADGWDDWTSYVAECVFDQACKVARQSNAGLGFFWSPEFINKMASVNPETGQPYDLVMTHPPGSAGFNAAEYNRRFVFWCYDRFLGRPPDAPGWDAWTNYLNSTGDYATVIHGFIYSSEYRDLIPHP